MALVKVVTTYETWVETEDETADALKGRIVQAVSSTLAFQQNVSSILNASPNLDVSAGSKIVNVSSHTDVLVVYPGDDGG